MLRRYLVGSLFALCLVAGCSKEAPPKPLAKATKEIKKEDVKPKSAGAVRFTLAPQSGEVTFDMQAPLERQEGRVPTEAVSGEVFFDLDDLTKSKGLVNVDISQLEIYMQKAKEEGADFGEREKSDTQNEHMRNWLEIGVDAPPEERKKNALVQFEMKRLEDASAPSLTGLSGAERTLQFTAVGEFRLHQRSEEKRVKLEAVFRYEGDKAVAVSVKTREPFPVDLDAHDVRPRTAFAKLAQKSLAAMSPKVAKEAQVSVSFEGKASTPKVAAK